MRSYFRKDYNPAFTRFTYPIKSFADFDAYTQECDVPLSKGVYGYNVRLDRGVLTHGPGIESAKLGDLPFPDTTSLGSPILKAALYNRYDYEHGKRDDMLFLLLENKRLYYAKLTDMSLVDTGLQVRTDGKVSFLNYHTANADYFFVMTDRVASYRFDGTSYITFEAPPSVCACVHGTRVFSVNQKNNMLSFCASMNPLDWIHALDSGGNIAFSDEGGALTGLISHKNAVYIFREFAVHRLVAYDDPDDFVVTKIFSGSRKIYFDTAALCSDGIRFMTEDGFWFFDGYRFGKVLYTHFPFIKNPEVSKAAFFDNKYYVAADLIRDGETVGEEDDSSVRNGVIFYDIQDKSSGIFRGADIRDFMTFSGKGKSCLLLLFGGARSCSLGTFTDDGRLFGADLKKYWRSPYTDFGYLNKIKVLKRLFIRATRDVRLTVRLDKDYPIELVGAQEARCIPVNRRAEKIGFSVETNGELNVSSLLFEFDFIRRLPSDGNIG